MWRAWDNHRICDVSLRPLCLLWWIQVVASRQSFCWLCGSYVTRWKLGKCIAFGWRFISIPLLPPADFRQRFCYSSELLGSDSNYATSADVRSEIGEHTFAQHGSAVRAIAESIQELLRDLSKKKWCCSYECSCVVSTQQNGNDSNELRYHMLRNWVIGTILFTLWIEAEYSDAYWVPHPVLLQWRSTIFLPLIIPKIVAHQCS